MRSGATSILVLVFIFLFKGNPALGAESDAAGDRGADMKKEETVTFFLCGDVMPGRGIDQVLSHSVDPLLYEPYVRDARVYVELAENANGLIPKPVGPGYIWGDALTVLDRISPDLRIINLETSITTSPEYWPLKGINYRMHPLNADVLTAAGIDCCVLANNHVLDWGYAGLLETLQTLEKNGIQQAGAGRGMTEASRPSIFALPGRGRVLVFAFGSSTSGIPREWAAAKDRPGVNLLPDLSLAGAEEMQRMIAEVRQPGDIVLASIHWGGNWGYEIPDEQRILAHRLIDEAGVDIVHGHSSHHVKGIEVYREKLIIYGSGDFLNDYEGISGHEEFRSDLSLMYFPRIASATGRLEELRLVPMQIRRFQTVHPAQSDMLWLHDLLNRLGADFNTGVRLNGDGSLTLVWDGEKRMQK